MAQPIFNFPNLATVGWSVHKRPTYASLVSTHVSGREVISPQQAFPLTEFELTYEILRDQTQNQSIDASTAPFTEYQQLWALFMACNAQWGLFYYSDPSDNSRSVAAIGTGNGTKTVFPVSRAVGTLGFTEPVGGIDQIQAVYFNSVVQSSSIYAKVGNTIVFTSAVGNGVVVTADFSYFFLCRFIEDMIDFEQFLKNRWKLRICKFRSVKQ